MKPVAEVVDRRNSTSGSAAGDASIRSALSGGKPLDFTVTCFDEAREDAKAAEVRFDSDDAPRLLKGLPLAVKDLSLTKGMRTTFGSLIYADYVPDRDDLVVQFVRDAGAVIIGKTHTTEFGAGQQHDQPSVQSHGQSI